MKNERIIDRFDKYMNIKDLNDNKVTSSLSFSIGLLGKSRKEGRDLSTKAVEKVLNFYKDIEKVWLLTGEGSMLKSEPALQKESISCQECFRKDCKIESLEGIIEKLESQKKEIERENKELIRENAVLNSQLDIYRSRNTG